LYVPVKQDLASLSPESRRRSASVPHPIETNTSMINTSNNITSNYGQMDTLRKKRIEFVLSKLNEPTTKSKSRPLMQTVSAAYIDKQSRPSLLRRGSLTDIFEDTDKEQAPSIPAVEEILSMKWDDFAKSLPRRVKHHTYYKDLAKANSRILEDGQTIINAFKLFQKPEDISDDVPPPPPPMPVKIEEKSIHTADISFKDMLSKKFAENQSKAPIIEDSVVTSNEELISSAPPLPPPLPPKPAELRVNMLSYGNSEIEYEEMFGITNDGINIWMINVELTTKVESVSPSNYGVFYENDCYLILNIPKETDTLKKSTDKTINLHMWVGSKSSVDKKAISAIRAVELNKYVNDKGIHFREEQGTETDLFQSYFPYGISVEEGGSENKFRNYAEVSVVSSRAVEFTSPLLYAVIWRAKEKKLINIIQVELKLESLNNCDVFLLDAGNKIFLWKGDKVDNVLFFLCLGIANQINISYRSSEATVIDLSDNQDPSLVGLFWKYIGGNTTSSPPNISDISQYTNVNESLYRLDKTVEGGFTLETLPSTQLGISKSLLLPDHCYLLHTDSQIFIWIGSKSSFKDRKAIRALAVEFIKKEQVLADLYSENEASESLYFKAKFIDWPSDTIKLLEARGKNIQPSYTGKLATEKSRGVNVADLVSSQDEPQLEPTSVFEEEEKPVLNETKGTAELWILDNIIGPQFSKWPAEERSHFYSEDAWMLLYTYYDSSDKQKYKTYFWEGQDCSSKWWASWSAGFFPTLEKKIVLSGGDPPTKERVMQWKESKAFSKLFTSMLVVHKGKYKQHVKQPRSVSLFQLTTINGVSRAIEIDLKSDLLNSKYIYLLFNNSSKLLYIWNGSLSSPEDKNISLLISQLFEATIQVIEEHNEPLVFWELIGHKSTKYLNQEFHSKYCNPIRLYKCSTLSGDFTIQQVLNFTQADLNNDESFFLDTYHELYLWIGQNSSESEKNLTQKAVKEYHTLISEKRNVQTPYLVISPETTIIEPIEFTRHFPAWNIKQNSLDPRQRTYLRYLERQKEEELSLLKQQEEEVEHANNESNDNVPTTEDKEEDNVIVIEVDSDSEIPTESELLQELHKLYSDSSSENSPVVSNRNSLDITDTYNAPLFSSSDYSIPNHGPPAMYLTYSDAFILYYLALQDTSIQDTQQQQVNVDTSTTVVTDNLSPIIVKEEEEPVNLDIEVQQLSKEVNTSKEEDKKVEVLLKEEKKEDNNKKKKKRKGKKKKNNNNSNNGVLSLSDNVPKTEVVVVPVVEPEVVVLPVKSEVVVPVEPVDTFTSTSSEISATVPTSEDTYSAPVQETPIMNEDTTTNSDPLEESTVETTPDSTTEIPLADSTVETTPADSFSTNTAIVDTEMVTDTDTKIAVTSFETEITPQPEEGPEDNNTKTPEESSSINVNINNSTTPISSPMGSPVGSPSQVKKKKNKNNNRRKKKR
jgi:hypothetical protein